MEAVRGIDVSHHQGVVDWTKVASAGYLFAFVKVSQGTTFADHMAKTNIERARAAGLLVGGYHYFTPTADATAQWLWFEKCVTEAAGGFEGMLPPVLDVEGDNSNGLAGMKPEGYALSAVAWLTAAQVKIGGDVRPIVYTYPSMAAQGGIGSYLGTYSLWAANYGGVAGKPTPFTGWRDKWTFHQFTDKGSVPGVAGKVDCNVFNGSEAQLRGMVVGTLRQGERKVKVVQRATGRVLAEYVLAEGGDHVADQSKLYVR